MLRIFFTFVFSLSSLVAAAETLVPAKLEDRSPREAVRKKIFPEGTPNRACKVLSKNLHGAVPEDGALTEAIQSLIKAINTSDGKELMVLFHPQLKVRLAQAKVALTSIERISGQKAEATLFKAYALNNMDGESSGIDCPEDGLVLHTLSAHPFQVAVWIQALGRDEVTRVFALLVPSKDKWQIGAWNVQQWTHAGKEFTEWRKEAEDLASKKQDIAAWLYYDLTTKLLDGGKFVVFPVAKDISAERDKLFPGKPLKEIISAKVAPEKLVYASSLFSRKGVSLLLRFGLPAEWSANAIRDNCRAKFKELSKEPWMSAIAGIRCDYVMPGESTEKEGRLGGIFVDKDNFAEK